MDKNFQLDDPILYTTGAYLQPLKVIDCDGSEKWLWAVCEFDGDSFLDGEILDPAEDGRSKQELLPSNSR